MTEALGEGFECAPTDDAETAAEAAGKLGTIIARLRVELLGEPPDSDDAAVPAYAENTEEIEATAKKWLQRVVRRRLN